MTFLKKTKFHLSNWQFFKFVAQKPKKIKKTPQNKKNSFSKIISDSFCQSKTA
jgi:hypothetical protein